MWWGFPLLLVVLLVPPSSHGRPSSRHFLVKENNPLRPPFLVELAKNLEYDQEIKGLFIPKNWSPDLSSDLYISSVRIIPTPAKLYSIGWKPALFLTQVCFKGTQEEFFMLAKKLSRESGFMIFLDGLTTKDSLNPELGWTVQGEEVAISNL